MNLEILMEIDYVLRKLYMALIPSSQSEGSLEVVLLS